MACCESPKYKLVEELGHAESVDWDLKQCLSCGAYYLQESSEYEGAGVYFTRLTDEQAKNFRHSQGRDRINLLKQWYNEH
ncbi:MAG: hypothetical protein DMG65_02570 [Candidatus Angelobacter sp. Gp1-AA117]|nr:MAG: hypothetical protein DMG65_02570 [Candidatus Angelobacter sp. Gp1-AA117]